MFNSVVQKSMDFLNFNKNQELRNYLHSWAMQSSGYEPKTFHQTIAFFWLQCCELPEEQATSVLKNILETQQENQGVHPLDFLNTVDRICKLSDETDTFYKTLQLYTKMMFQETTAETHIFFLQCAKAFFSSKTPHSFLEVENTTDPHLLQKLFGKQQWNTSEVNFLLSIGLHYLPNTITAMNEIHPITEEVVFEALKLRTNNFKNTLQAAPPPPSWKHFCDINWFLDRIALARSSFDSFHHLSWTNHINNTEQELSLIQMKQLEFIEAVFSGQKIDAKHHLLCQRLLNCTKKHDFMEAFNIWIEASLTHHHLMQELNTNTCSKTCSKKKM